MSISHYAQIEKNMRGGGGGGYGYFFLQELVKCLCAVVVVWWLKPIIVLSLAQTEQYKQMKGLGAPLLLKINISREQLPVTLFQR